MKCVSYAILVTAAAVLVAGAARAESEAEYSSPSPSPSPAAGARSSSPSASPFGPRAIEPAKPKANPSLFAPASAANAKPMSAQQREERQFLKDAAATGRFESDASRLALSKSSNSAVRSFAATLINHHTASGNELLYMLQVRGMAPPMLANDKRKTLNRLAKLQGAKFDREYMAQVALKNQQEDVQSFERASLNTRDPQLKAWIDRTVPTLRYHLTTGERMAPSDIKPVKVAGPTQSMGAGPSQLGMKHNPVATWSIESNTR
ncbi:MAG: hypothetical protein JWQ07_3245 [Ramlibacter sp.]|nr:hypothetical protein [Ramlibacter sp.]